MQHAERTTILEALRHHDGDKARTAAALDIGRATLYRSLRGYRGIGADQPPVPAGTPGNPRPGNGNRGWCA
ncbi:helix-turn-helix domain-containing protein [Streptomyces sp. IMTB 2501]|uniref:helix-turn-helix domain-containing protein n=1 Tax=Streptomyces sp. IMTB 2501 TaxID=1776340 RepID=UPI003531CEF8